MVLCRKIQIEVRFVVGMLVVDERCEQARPPLRAHRWMERHHPYVSEHS